MFVASGANISADKEKNNFWLSLKSEFFGNFPDGNQTKNFNAKVDENSVEASQLSCRFSLFPGRYFCLCFDLLSADWDFYEVCEVFFCFFFIEVQVEETVVGDVFENKQQK